MCECDFLVVGALANRNDFGSVLLFLLKHNGEDTIFELGLDSAFIFLDWNRQGDGAREFTPIAFLNVPGGSIFIFPAAQDAGDSENIIGNGDVEVGFGNTGRACFYY